MSADRNSPTLLVRAQIDRFIQMEFGVGNDCRLRAVSACGRSVGFVAEDVALVAVAVVSVLSTGICSPNRSHSNLLVSAKICLLRSFVRRSVSQQVDSTPSAPTHEQWDTTSTYFATYPPLGFRHPTMKPRNLCDRRAI